MMDDNLKKIETFLEVIPEGNAILSEHIGYSEMKMDNGIAFAFGLMHIPEIAVSKTVISKGAGFTDHRHSMTEWIIVFSGKLQFTMEGKTGDLLPGEGVKITAGTKHSALAIENTKIIAITIPADPTFPKEMAI